MPAQKAVRVTVQGKVQGVYFRQSTATEARALGVRGWVRNRDDGSVEGWFEGDAAAVDALVAWCRRGPPAARVEFVGVEAVTAEGHAAFDVRR